MKGAKRGWLHCRDCGPGPTPAPTATPSHWGRGSLEGQRPRQPESNLFLGKGRKFLPSNTRSHAVARNSLISAFGCLRVYLARALTSNEQLRPSIADSRSLTSGERKTVGVPGTAGNGGCAKEVAANKPPLLGRLQRSRVPAIGYNHAAASGCLVCPAPESAGLPAMNRPCTRPHNYCTGGSRDNGSSVIALPTILRFRRYEGSPTVLFCIQPEKLAKWASCSCACASDARVTQRSVLGLTVAEVCWPGSDTCRANISVLQYDAAGLQLSRLLPSSCIPTVTAKDSRGRDWLPRHLPSCNPRGTVAHWLLPQV